MTTYKIRHYLYKAFSKGSKPVDWVLGAYVGLHPVNWGKPAYSHVEIGFERPDGTFLCFSSSSRSTVGGKGGCRFITEEDLLKHPERWDVYEEVVCEKTYQGVLKRAKAADGLPYDWKGIAGFVPFGWKIDDKLKWYCSEICHAVRMAFRKRVSPTLWATWVKKNCRKIAKEELCVT